MLPIHPDAVPGRAFLIAAWHHECIKAAAVRHPHGHARRGEALFEALRAENARRRELLERASDILPFSDFLAGLPRKKVPSRAEAHIGTQLDVYA